MDANGQLDFNKLQLQAAAKTSKGEKFLSVGTGLLPPEGPYPKLSVEVKGLIEVSVLKLTPASPRSGEEYTATGIISCLIKGDVVNISVVGTDGYTDAISNTISETGNQDFSLSVPGADSGIQDVVSLKIIRAGIEIGNRIASLVFS